MLSAVYLFAGIVDLFEFLGSLWPLFPCGGSKWYLADDWLQA